MFTSEEISKAREIAAKATPRPWKSDRYEVTHHVDDPYDRRGYTSRFITVTGGISHSADDATYIALACNEFPAALDEIERLRAALEELRNLSQLELPDDELTHWALHRLITINKISTTALQGGE